MSPPSELLPAAIQMILALIAVLGGIGLLVFMSRRLMNRSRGRAKSAVIRVIASNYIGVKKSISLVEVPGAILILGLTSDRIVMLGKVEDPELYDQLRKGSGPAAGEAFSEHLRRLSPWAVRERSKENPADQVEEP